ncbi:MAG: (2Fe-2S)-binding protein, partial [Eggerthellaceae bacterium]|nr:(2Fe-2S)-binding protein [Eggerthellaceae bacterium]
MENNMINLTIDSVEVSVPEGSTVLQAAFACGIKIPTLCYLAGVNEIGACRMCVVEVEGARSLMAACVCPVSEGMVIRTDSEKVLKSRRNTLELMLSNHRCKCLTCERNQNCELQHLAVEIGIDMVKYQMDNLEPELDTSAIHLIRDNSKCILCRRCTAVCKESQEVAVIGAADRGFRTHIESPFGRGLGEVDCIHCGQCITNCPTGAIILNKQIDQVEEALKDPSMKVVAMPAPSVRVGLGEEFGMDPGENTELKMATALRRIGFDYVFDVNWGADITIMEESTELLGRIKNGGKFPMFTSCCPGWVKFMEYNHPDMLDNLSSCKSPLEMQSGVIKTYFAEKEGIDPKDLVVVSIMPCTAKKFEIS